MFVYCCDCACNNVPLVVTEEGDLKCIRCAAYERDGARQEHDEYPDDWFELSDDDDGFCETCYGTGTIITCCDDICNALGHCIHGDGEEFCPECGCRNPQ